MTLLGRLAIAVLSALWRGLPILPAVAGLLLRRTSVLILTRWRSVLSAAGGGGSLVLAVVRAVDGAKDQLHQLHILLKFPRNCLDYTYPEIRCEVDPFPSHFVGFALKV